MSAACSTLSSAQAVCRRLGINQFAGYLAVAAEKAGIAGLKRWKWRSGWTSHIVLAGGSVGESLVAWDFDLLGLWYPGKLVLAVFVCVFSFCPASL